jgi:hypothetical protein
VFVGLFDDTLTTTVTGATISDQFYGADVNFRMRTPLFASLPIFDVMFGLRYAALSERLTASVNALATRTFQPALGLPPPVNFNDTLSGSGAFTIRNDFIGPQVGFNAEKHWGPFWVGNESKLAVGAMIEQESASGSTDLNITPTRLSFWPASAGGQWGCAYSRNGRPPLRKRRWYQGGVCSRAKRHHHGRL